MPNKGHRANSWNEKSESTVCASRCPYRKNFWGSHEVKVLWAQPPWRRLYGMRLAALKMVVHEVCRSDELAIDKVLWVGDPSRPLFASSRCCRVEVDELISVDDAK
jgi:hypothetical protein